MPVIFLWAALGLLLWGAERVFVRLWKQDLELEISFQDQPAQEGEKASLTETIKNKKRFPVPLLHVKFQASRNLDFVGETNVSVSDRSYKNDLFAVMPYQQIKRTIPFVCKKRGYYTIDKAELVSSFIFFRDFQYDARRMDTCIYVYPGRIQMPELDVFLRQLSWSLMSKRRLYEDPFSFAGVREYESYDSLKNINWNATAKTGDLMVNVREYTSGQPVVILVNLQDSITWHTDSLLEESIRLAATAAEKLMNEGVPVTIWTTYDKGNLPLPEVSGKMLARINEKLAVLDLEKPCMDYAEWIETCVMPVYDEDYTYLVVSYEEREAMREATEKLAEYQGELWLLLPFFEDEPCPAHSARIHQLERAVNWHE